MPSSERGIDGAPANAYPHVEPKPSYPELEQRVLDDWEADGTFAASITRRAGGSNEYVFYDGPPFANGLPHYGHLLTGFVKDAVPRYQTMRGRRVERRFGWDCHGLPAEMEAEKELDLSGRSAIEQYGVDRFNDYCRSLVLRTTDAWERYVTRQARWVAFADAYKTMDTAYMESVMWAFRTLWDKGLVYEGLRVLPYCWECETPLSNFETRQDDAYRERTDPSVVVAFELVAEPTPRPGEATTPEPGTGLPPGPIRLLAWTTTPWTLPSNLALAVGPDLDYTVFRRDGVVTVASAAWVAENPELAGTDPSGGPAEVLGSVKGTALVGRRYRPLFPYFAETTGAFRVLGVDFVSTDEGTGIVHLAPGFGEDDQRACEAAGIPVVCPVDDRGAFTDEVPDLSGIHVFDANQRVVDDLAAKGVLVLTLPYVHSYPHCWRSDTPLIYRALSSWFVRVTAIRDRMMELNRTIDWVPAHVRDGAFGKWLEGARDWSISRNRYWGAPIPVWKSDDPRYARIDVYGSLDELEKDFGVRPADLHRPEIDALTRPNPDDPTGKATMRRVTDVLDCWFESGSMPFAQVHYPFEDKDWFESHFPADFIVEYVGQTRGWFYTLHVLATALFDRPPFRHCVAHGIVLGDDGRKLSKRLGNFPDPEQVFASYGADAMRWFLLSSAVLRGQNLVVDEESIAEAVRQVLNPIWNTWYFLNLYAGIDGVRGSWRTDQSGVLDRYILAKTGALLADVTASMDGYDLFGACSAITSYLDSLNNWYIRRSRERFWRPAVAGNDDTGEDAAAADKRDAYDTLHTVLAALCRIAAPLLPLLTETIYRQLTGERSVHLTDWIEPDALPQDPDLVAAMDRVREICSAAHSIRKATGHHARLPLASLTIAAPWAASFSPYRALIADEINVKSVVLTDEIGDAGRLVLHVEPALVGPRIGPATQKVITAVKAGDWQQHPDGTVVAAGIELALGEFRLQLRPTDETSGRALPDESGIVSLDLTLTPALAAEGTARDAVRLVQSARKAAGLFAADRIELTITVPPAAAEAIETHRRYVMDQTLAVAMTLVASEGAIPPAAGRGQSAPGGADGDAAEGFTVPSRMPDGSTATITVRRA